MASSRELGKVNLAAGSTLDGGGFESAGAWQSFTPTGNWTNTTYEGFWRRSGPDSVDIRYQLTLTGTPTQSSGTYLLLPFPSGLALDTSKYPTSVGNFPAGRGYYRDNTASDVVLASAVVETPSSIRAELLDPTDPTGIKRDITTVSTPFTWAVDDVISLEILSLPVTGL